MNGNSDTLITKSYNEYKGERLYDVENIYNVKDFEIHSFKLENRLRLIVEWYKDLLVVTLTDLANHEYRGQPYAKQYSEN